MCSRPQLSIKKERVIYHHVKGLRWAEVFEEPIPMALQWHSHIAPQQSPAQHLPMGPSARMGFVPREKLCSSLQPIPLSSPCGGSSMTAAAVPSMRAHRGILHRPGDLLR